MSVKFYVVNELTMEHNPIDEVLRENDTDVTVCLNLQYSPQWGGCVLSGKLCPQVPPTGHFKSSLDYL